MKRKRTLIRISMALLIVFLIMNLVAYFHAYKFTHFAVGELVKTRNPQQLSFYDKIKTLAFGVNNPRPANKVLPPHPFESFKLQSNKIIDCWNIRAQNAKGTVVIFHGYSGEKSSMLDKAEVFFQLGYNSVLVDFMGVGGSEGSQTTIGFYEAEEVKTVVNYLHKKGEKNIILYGTSMGAAAVMKALSEENIPASSVILECPFGSMLKTVQARFENMSVPSFPMANLLVFWGGFQNNFDAFSHNPVSYARKINIPTLLLYGEKDEEVSREEINEIYENLRGLKKLRTYPLAGHENYLRLYNDEWRNDVSDFLVATKKRTTL